jgi:hypothetical protein
MKFNAIADPVATKGIPAPANAPVSERSPINDAKFHIMIIVVKSDVAKYRPPRGVHGASAGDVGQRKGLA